jgi:small subunit ribosomal protein S15
MVKVKDEKQSIVKKYQQHPKDCGSAEVQVAILSQRINHLSEHLAGHKKDFATRRGLMMLVGKRSKLLEYLESKDAARYQKLIQSLGLRK